MLVLIELLSEKGVTCLYKPRSGTMAFQKDIEPEWDTAVKYKLCIIAVSK
jgi:hypothetical protein